ncbi:esterase [Nocardia yamanashiensis]|uniref:alpha/beta hydrolase-fold protein n=1 Tax=Nocardia yamanashiensis TaxID=209247 RepID=UPI001E312F1D|nr:alpha/beta hydrolase-fold protein [Nocardia yamanashiensis]UGT40367.1 esterase [Nocardia yamanashiensis]
MAGVVRGTRRARRRGAIAALAAVFPLAAGAVVAAGPVAAAPETGGVPASVQKSQWLNDRRVSLWVNSPATGAPVEVQLLLPRDWHSRPDARYPVLFMLDGLRATDDENGWTKDAGAAGWFADKNTLVVLPVGGQSSFYADWLEPNNGRNYKWETFLTKELPPLLESQWRATSQRAVAGLSMGGSAAMMLAARNPGWVKHAASYSGFLTLTTLGMPQAVNFAMKDAGGFDSTAMFGPPGNDAWKEHDPYELAEKLRGLSLYVSSGSGTAGATDPPGDLPGLTTNYAGMGLEVLSRLSTQNFVAKLNKLNIPVQVNYRPSGTHTWPYWDFEMRQSWPQTAAALGVDATAGQCTLGGAIAGVAQANNWLGDCLTGEYPVNNGVAQDFRGGQVFFSPATGAQPTGGAIGGSYAGLNGAASGLGFPTAGDGGLPDGRGRWQTFQNGSIYWTPQTGAQAVRGAVLDAWGKQGFERSPAGYPTGLEQRTPSRDGVVQGFENGPMYFSPKTGAHLVQGLILGKYSALGFENSPYGFPVADEQPLKDFGRYSAFENGNIYWSPLSGAWGVRNGPIMDAWGALGFENGNLGFPMADETQVPGGVQQTFQFGSIVVRDGKPQALTHDGKPIALPGVVDPKPDAKPVENKPEQRPAAKPEQQAAPTAAAPEPVEGFPLPIPALGPEVRPNN